MIAIFVVFHRNMETAYYARRDLKGISRTGYPGYLDVPHPLRPFGEGQTQYLFFIV